MRSPTAVPSRGGVSPNLLCHFLHAVIQILFWEGYHGYKKSYHTVFSGGPGHPGNYVFYDNIRMALGAVPESRCALTVLGAIISHPREDFSPRYKIKAFLFTTGRINKKSVEYIINGKYSE